MLICNLQIRLFYFTAVMKEHWYFQIKQNNDSTTLMSFWHAIICMLLVLWGLLLCTACENKEKPAGSVNGYVVVVGQVISQNKVAVASVTLIGNNGWLVAHKDFHGQPKISDVMTKPVNLDEGTTKNVFLALDSHVSISDGDSLWIMLHEDTGKDRVFEFGEGQRDIPVKTLGDFAANPIRIKSPEIIAADQPVSNNRIMIDQIVSGANGWVVVYLADGSNTLGLSVGHTRVSEGKEKDVLVSLLDTIDYEEGMELYLRLHLDKGKFRGYEFPGPDVPEIFGNSGNNEIITSITVESNS